VHGRFHRGLEAATLTLAAVLVALAIFAGFLAANRLDPLEVDRVLYLGAFGTRFSIETTLTRAAPLMLTALCVAIPARAGLLVIGGEGALVMGGIGTVLAAVALDGAPPAAATPNASPQCTLRPGRWPIMNACGTGQLVGLSVCAKSRMGPETRWLSSAMAM
jgi:simple sugar transport system permease protein